MLTMTLAPPADDETGPKVKGMGFQSVMRQVELLHGADAKARAMARMPESVRDLFDGILLAQSWYPIALYRAMWSGIVEAIGGGPEVVRRIGRESLIADTNTFYRAMLRVLSPKTITQVGARYFNRFYDTGTMRVLASERQRIAARFEGCLGFDHTMWIEVSGSIEAFVELAGVKDVMVNVTGGGRDGDDWAEMTARWR